MSTIVYRTYDQAELDRQYDNRGAVADSATCLERYRARSAQARSRMRYQTESYGMRARERMDIFPSTAPGAPMLVFVHGGAWQSQSKEDSAFAAPVLVQSGAAYVAIDFDQIPDATLASMAAQTLRAYAWIAAHAERFGGDPQRIHLCGHSSGAHLTARLLATDWAAHGLWERRPRGATVVSGLFDLEPVRLSYRNQVLKLGPDSVYGESPLHRLPGDPCPLIVAYGANETDEFRRQSCAFAQAWNERHPACLLLELPGRHHFDAVEALAEGGSTLSKAVLEQMGLAAA